MNCLEYNMLPIILLCGEFHNIQALCETNNDIDIGTDAVVARTLAKPKIGSSAVWDEMIFLPMNYLTQQSSVSVSFRLINANRWDDLDSSVGTATTEINLDKHRHAIQTKEETTSTNILSQGSVSDSCIVSQSREMLDLVVLDYVGNSRGILRCELIGITGHSSPSDTQISMEPETIASKYSHFDGALYLHLHGTRYLDQFLKHSSLEVSPHVNHSSQITSLVKSFPAAKHLMSTNANMQVKRVALRRGAFVIIPIDSKRIPSIIRVQVVELKSNNSHDEQQAIGGTNAPIKHLGDSNDNLNCIRFVDLPLQWFMGNTDGTTAAPDWFSLQPSKAEAPIPTVGWGQVQLSGMWIPSASGSLKVKVQYATGLPQRLMVNDEDIFVRFNVGRRSFKTSLTPQSGHGAQWNNVQRFPYSLWRDDFSCHFALIRDTNLQDNVLGSLSVPVPVLLGKSNVGTRNTISKVGRTIYGEHTLKLHTSDIRTHDKGSINAQTWGGMISASNTNNSDKCRTLLKVHTTFEPTARQDAFTNKKHAIAVEVISLKRLFYELDEQKCLVVNRQQLCNAATSTGATFLAPQRLESLAEQDKMITWTEWAVFLTDSSPLGTHSNLFIVNNFKASNGISKNNGHSSVSMNLSNIELVLFKLAEIYINTLTQSH